MRRHTQVDACGPDLRLHRPATDERAGPDLAEFEDAEGSFVGVRLARKENRRENQQDRPDRPGRGHCSYRTL